MKAIVSNQEGCLIRDKRSYINGNVIGVASQLEIFDSIKTDSDIYEWIEIKTLDDGIGYIRKDDVIIIDDGPIFTQVERDYLIYLLNRTQENFEVGPKNYEFIENLKNKIMGDFNKYE